MKFMITLIGVQFNIEDEYTHELVEELLLGIIEADNKEEAIEKAKKLEKDCYNNYGGKHNLGYPYLSIRCICNCE